MKNVRKWMIVAIAVGFATMIQIDRANAQTADLGCPAAGTVLTTSNGNVLTFGANSGNSCAFRVGNRTYTRFAIFWDPNSGMLKSDSGSEKALSLWPLQVGKSISIQWSGPSSIGGDQGTWYYAFKVERQEKVRVAAGEFDTFVVTQTESGAGSNSFKGVSTFWYAPQVGYLVKFTYAFTGFSRNPPKDWELVSIVK